MIFMQKGKSLIGTGFLVRIKNSLEIIKAVGIDPDLT